MRRTKQLVEIVGIDPNSMEVITNEVFRWNPATDDFVFSGKSYVLEKIMVKINFSQEDMRRELRTRKRILEWMVLNDIRKADRGLPDCDGVLRSTAGDPRPSGWTQVTGRDMRWNSRSGNVSATVCSVEP